MNQKHQPKQAIRLHHFTISGHSHRVQLFLSLLGLPCDIVPVDLTTGAQRKPEFLALNPAGQVPVIEDGDYTQADSNAILVYLARRYDPDNRWLPRDAVGEAEVQYWLSMSAGWLAYGPAHLRAARLFKRPLEARGSELAERLLKVMEGTLAKFRWLCAGERPTIADVAMYTYTAHAPEGGVDLAPYPQVRRWIADFEALPGFVPMPRS